MEEQPLITFECPSQPFASSRILDKLPSLPWPLSSMGAEPLNVEFRAPNKRLPTNNTKCGSLISNTQNQG